MTMDQADQVSYILVSTQYDELKEVSDSHCGRTSGQTGDDPMSHHPWKMTLPLVKISVDPVKASAEGLAPARWPARSMPC